jgi:hypothetical protein
VAGASTDVTHILGNVLMIELNVFCETVFPCVRKYLSTVWAGGVGVEAGFSRVHLSFLLGPNPTSSALFLFFRP